MDAETETLVTKAITMAGVAKVARACHVSHPAVARWRKNGRLPRTDLTGETHYAEVLATLTPYRHTELLDATKQAYSARAREVVPSMPGKAHMEVQT